MHRTSCLDRERLRKGAAEDTEVTTLTMIRGASESKWTHLDVAAETAARFSKEDGASVALGSKDASDMKHTGRW